VADKTELLDFEGWILFLAGDFWGWIALGERSGSATVRARLSEFVRVGKRNV
jgi:hypothetical protein